MAKRENSEERCAFPPYGDVASVMSDKSAFPPNSDVAISLGNIYTNEIIYNSEVEAILCEIGVNLTPTHVREM